MISTVLYVGGLAAAWFAGATSVVFLSWAIEPRQRKRRLPTRPPVTPGAPGGSWTAATDEAIALTREDTTWQL